MRTLRGMLVLAVSLYFCGFAYGADKPRVRFGGDLRLREIYFDDIPIKADPPGVTRGGQNHFFRVRTRIWGEADLLENVTARARIVNEFRMYDKPHNLSWDYPDEAIVDTLYIEARDLFGERLDVRIGRQDLIYGTGKLILEGTPKDGSRTIYFDAVKASWKGFPDTVIDLLGIYNKPENELVINSQDRDLTGYTKYYDDAVESGGGVYIKNSSLPVMPFEAYYIYKHESSWDQPAARDADGNPLPPRLAWQELNTAEGVIENPRAKIHTVGFRLMPKPSERLSANIECAYQFGERGDEDIEAYGSDSFIIYKLPVLERYSPSVNVGFYYLSGDDPHTAKDEGWNPLWARWPQYSELYVYAYDADAAGRWSNLMMPHMGVKFKALKNLSTEAMLGYMWAPEKDGPGGGDERGLLFTLWNKFVLGKNLVMEGDELAGHILLELMDPGNYYNVDDTALFARWELTYRF